MENESKDSFCFNYLNAFEDIENKTIDIMVNKYGFKTKTQLLLALDLLDKQSLQLNDNMSDISLAQKLVLRKVLNGLEENKNIKIEVLVKNETNIELILIEDSDEENENQMKDVLNKIQNEENDLNL